MVRSANETTPARISAADALAAVKAAQKTTLAHEVDDHGYTWARDKSKLIGKNFTIVDWEDSYEPEKDTWFAVVHIVMGDKTLVFQDSSTVGIRQQLIDLKAAGTETMIACPRGLRVSEYDNPYGGRSKTFYLDNSAL